MASIETTILWFWPCGKLAEEELFSSEDAAFARMREGRIGFKPYARPTGCGIGHVEVTQGMTVERFRERLVSAAIANFVSQGGAQ